ncbi:MAG TPA: hypothetical protein VE029_02320 [Rhizobacter sp.]|nr:hypothetical protein [Rhizobacter sp.]
MKTVDEVAGAAEAQPLQPEPNAARRGVWTGVLIGLALGVAGSYVVSWLPAQTEGIDYNHDGLLDETRTYAPTGVLLKTETDRNFDGKVDHITYFDRQGLILSSDADNDFDGVFETRTRYQNGHAATTEVDSDGDGYPDTRSEYAHGVLSTTTYFNPATGHPLRIEYYRLGKVTRAEKDNDHDGRLDTRHHYTPFGEPKAPEVIR